MICCSKTSLSASWGFCRKSWINVSMFSLQNNAGRCTPMPWLLLTLRGGSTHGWGMCVTCRCLQQPGAARTSLSDVNVQQLYGSFRWPAPYGSRTYHTIPYEDRQKTLEHSPSLSVFICTVKLTVNSVVWTCKEWYLARRDAICCQLGQTLRTPCQVKGPVLTSICIQLACLMRQ